MQLEEQNVLIYKNYQYFFIFIFVFNWYNDNDKLMKVIADKMI